MDFHLDIRLEFSWPNRFWQDIQTDRYLGIRFQDGFNRTHYGWIRCDAPDSGRCWSLKTMPMKHKPEWES